MADSTSALEGANRPRFSEVLRAAAKGLLKPYVVTYRDGQEVIVNGGPSCDAAIQKASMLRCLAELYEVHEDGKVP